jgi:hypothetical protein
MADEKLYVVKDNAREVGVVFMAKPRTDAKNVEEELECV